jgi:hypothetical protein
MICVLTPPSIDGRVVDVKRALPRDKAPGPSRSEACKIFVGGLAADVVEVDFSEYFSAFGLVKDAVVMVDRNTGSSRYTTILLYCTTTSIPLPTITYNPTTESVTLTLTLQQFPIPRSLGALAS